MVCVLDIHCYSCSLSSHLCCLFVFNSSFCFMDFRTRRMRWYLCLTIQAGLLEAQDISLSMREPGLRPCMCQSPVLPRGQGLFNDFRALCLLISPECVVSITSERWNDRSFPHMCSCQSSAAGSCPHCELGDLHLALSTAALAHAK